MSDLVPVRVEYNITFTPGSKQSYSVSGEVAVSEASDILRMYDDNINSMAEYFNTGRYT